MEPRPVKRLNRAQRLHKLLRTGWHSAHGIIHGVGTVKHTNAISELRAMGVRVVMRRSGGVIEYMVPR